ncbi:sensor histidine kinase [Paenibacillus sp. sgz500958]|uniref:sensor histidine kinase n=1 Tax=Paenibacillus sp. sgz500958 TaxID=3242475 RepID=UPI0036D3B678
MRRHSVVLKLFLVTTTLVLIVFSLVMLAEGLFFERFYKSTKVEALERRMNTFAESYPEAGQSEPQAARKLGTFMNRSDASVSLLNNRFERVTINPYDLELQAEGKTITVPIPMNGLPVDAIPPGIQIGDSLTIDGIFMDQKDTIMQPVEFQPPAVNPGPGLVRVNGKVIDLLLPEQRSYNPLYQDALITDALRDWMLVAEDYRSELDAGSPVRMDWQDQWSGIQYAVMVRALPEGSINERYVFVMTSLQPVGEAVGILRQYFIYAAPVIVLLVVLLSLFYSRAVSRPLVILNRSAAKLAKLDFSGQPEIHSRDEFGELSESMITMSRNLDTTLSELHRANEQLQEDVAEQERSEQLRKELIANISHELKTPLGIVKGFAEGLQDGVAGEKRDRYLALIVNETDRMNALIMDMLELSKFEAKAVRLNPGSLLLASLIQRVAESFTRQMENKHLQLRILTEDSEELYVVADTRRIEQVVLNLLSNAIRHAEEHSVITIDIGRTSPDTITTVIENQGPPIAREDLERIWDQFYRAERSRDRKSGGTGLGLAIVKHILELHNSRYEAVNTQHGVAFSFSLQESRGETYE